MSAFEGIGGASGPVKSWSLLEVAPKLCSPQKSVVVPVHTKPTTEQYVDTQRSFDRIGVIDIKAQANLVPDMAEDGGVSTIDNGREVFFDFVDVLCAMRARRMGFAVFCILLCNLGKVSSEYNVPTYI